MTALMLMAPLSVGGLGWPIAAFLFTPILLLLFQSQRVHLTWRRTIVGLAVIVLVTAAAGIRSGIICIPCENCDPWWILLGICIPR